MKKVLNQRGSNLVELMVVASLMGGMALVGTQLTTNMNKNSKGTETKFETIQVTNEIRGHLSSKEACMLTFGAANFSTCTGSAEVTSGVCRLSLGAG